MRDLLAGFLLGALLLTCTAAAADGDDAPDSLVVDLPDIVVTGGDGAPPPADRTSLGPAQIAVRDAGSLAELGLALPSARISVNSRGDAHAMVRGAPERHVQTFLDGIPLNLPWDERVDLETIPSVGVGRIEGRRGPATLLDGPGALAGSVRLLPPTLAGAPARTRAGLALGEYGRGRADLLHQRRAGQWNLMGAGAWQQREAWPLPEGGGPRRNSDLRQLSLLMRGARPVRGNGRLSLLASAWTGEKGVPAELHLPPDEARQWRYPVRERALFGAALDLPLDRAGLWDLGAAASADFHHQEIDPRGPDRWGAPLQPGDSYEKSWDRTGFSRLRLTRWIGSSASAALQASARYTNHRESVAAGAPVLAYAQWLTSVAAESEVVLGNAWTLRGGLGWDHAATPESGDKEANDPLDRFAGNLRVSHDLGEGRSIYAAASSRSRFPSLRESYSGALDRFVPNPDLAPERQDQIELGGAVDRDFWRVEVAAFDGRLTDGIEKVAVQETPDDRRFMRVNRSRINTSGWEVLGTLRMRDDLHGHVQHMVLSANVEQPDHTARPAEDRPRYQSLADLAWRPPAGPGATLEARVTGPRWSADATAVDGLTELPAGVTWHLRLAWRWTAGGGDLEAHLRLDNLFDQRVDYQVGLPGAGRVVSGGVGLSL